MERELHLFEELCAKGKAYRRKRMAAGEKSSAYLSGRAVKVCKGQMQGEGEDMKENIPTSFTDKDLDDLRDIILKYVEDPDDAEAEVQRFDDGGFDNMSDMVTANLLRDPEYKAWYNKVHSIEEEVYEEIDALHENEEYCPKCATKIKEAIREEVKKVAKEAKTKPAKGKRFAKKVKNPKTGRTRTVSYGQAGKAKKGGDRIRPGTKKGDAYCARSAKIKKCKNPPCANTLSRKKWKCRGTKSMK
jgi:hypothetical protein